MSVFGFLGQRATTDFTVTGQRPENWREMILRQFPNGDAPLTAFMSLASSENTDDPKFHWFQKTLQTQRAEITGVFTNVALTTAYVSGGVAGDTLFLQMATADVARFRDGHQLLLRDSSNKDVDTVAKCIDLGANYIAAKLLQADTGSTVNDLSDADAVLVTGNINAEGAQRPDAISYDPTEYSNYCQIYRDPLDITNTAKQTRLRTGKSYEEQKLDCLNDHSIGMEKAMIWGIPSIGVGSNGQPERTMAGLVYFTKTFAPDNVSDFSNDADFAGKTWREEDGGREWLDNILEVIFRYGDNEKLAFVGSGALLGIQKLANAGGVVNITPETTAFGLKVKRWITAFGDVLLKTHPLFSFEATNRNSMLVFEPQRIKMRPLDGRDTKFIPQKTEQGDNGIDGVSEEYITELGIEYHHANTGGWLNGIGVDNVL